MDALPAPKAVAIPERPPENPQPHQEDSSRVVAVIAILQLLIAAGGLCIFVGMTSVMGQYGSDSRSRGFALTVRFVMRYVGSDRVGLLRRVGAWAFSLGLIISSLVFLALSVLMGAWPGAIRVAWLSTGLYLWECCSLLKMAAAESLR